MKSKRNITCVLLSLSLILGSSTIVYASPAAGDMQDNAQNMEGFKVEEMSPVDLSGVDPENITQLPQNEVAAEEETEPSQELSSQFNNLGISQSDLKNAKDFREIAEEVGTSTLAEVPYEMVSVSDVMSPDVSLQLYTISVPSGKYLQAELLVPQNLSLNYDLFLLELDAATSEYKVVSGSEYATDSSFMAEGAGIINNSDSAVTYYIAVDANAKSSTEDIFTINASVSVLSTPYEQMEPNESGFYAVDFPAMAVPSTVTVSAGLNSPIDNDWFRLYVANTTEFAALEIQGVPSSMVVESYRVSGANTMVKMGSTLNSDTLPIAQGYTYFRIVSNRSGAFTPKDYNIEFSTALKATKTYTLVAVNGYCQRTSNNWNDGINRRLLISSSNVEVRVMYLTEDNYFAKVDDKVDVEIYNPSWDNPDMQYGIGEQSIKNANTCSVLLQAPVVRGLGGYNFVYTTITSSKFGSIANNSQMALLDRYGNGELEEPCLHNGTCGLK